MTIRLSIAHVVAFLELDPEPDARARAEALDREAQRLEAEGRRSAGLGTGAEGAWRERAAAKRRAAQEALLGGES